MELFLQTGALKLPPPSFIPLVSEGPGGNLQERVRDADNSSEGLSAEEYAMLRTKEFNVRTRERPYDLKLWLEFAEFQSEVATIAARKVCSKQR